MNVSPFVQKEFGLTKITNGKYIMIYLDKDTFTKIVHYFDKNIDDFPKMEYYLLDLTVGTNCKYISHKCAGLKTKISLPLLERILFDNFKSRTIFTLTINDNKINFPIVLSKSVKIMLLKKFLNCDKINDEIIN
jgi:hypothetical protein